MPDPASSPKNTLDRYRRLNDALNDATSNGRPISTERLCKKVEVSDRQLRTDRAFFVEILKAPIQWNEREKGWIYADPFAFIDRLGVTNAELQQLRAALEMLTEQEGLESRFGLLRSLFEKIEQQTRGVSTQTLPPRVLFFETSKKYEGSARLPFFLNAIDQKWRVEFDYQAFGTEPRRIVFEPQFLKHFAQIWYVGGQSLDPDELDFIRVFPLERIVGEPQKIGFAQIEPLQTPEKYWQNIYGINDPKDDKTVENVRLRFSSFYKNYFLAAPFFEPFRAEEQPDGSLVVEFALKINWELRRKIASFGPDATVLGPPRLVEDMRSFFEKALENLIS